MDHSGAGKTVSLLQTKEFWPRHITVSASPRQLAAPDPSRSLPTFLEAGEVSNDPVIPVVALQLLRELMVLLPDRKVQILSTPFRQRCQRALESVFRRFPFDHPYASLGSASHLPISRWITPSRTRRLRNSRKWPWLIVSKNFRRSTSWDRQGTRGPGARTSAGSTGPHASLGPARPRDAVRGRWRRRFQPPATATAQRPTGIHKNFQTVCRLPDRLPHSRRVPAPPPR